MHSLSRFLPPLTIAALLVGCSGGGTQQQASLITPLPAMSSNCEWMQSRFDTAVTSLYLCTGQTSETLQSVKPQFVGAQLISVQRKNVSLNGIPQNYFEYDLTLRSRTNMYSLSTFSKTEVDLAVGKFYALDLYNACRFQVLESQTSPSQTLLDSFSMPHKLSCLD